MPKGSLISGSTAIGILTHPAHPHDPGTRGPCVGHRLDQARCPIPKHGDRVLARHVGSHNQRRIVQDRARTSMVSSAA